MQKCLVVIGCLYTLCACSTPFNSGISGETPVNSISGEDETALCTAIETEADAQGAKEATKKVACYIGGALAAAFSTEDDPEAVCQAAADECIEGEEESDASCELDFGECAAPLADYEACTLATWEEMKTMAEDISCATEEAEEGEAEEESCTNPEACAAFYEACPDMDPCNVAEE